MAVHLIFSVANNDLTTAVFSHEAAGIVSSVGSEIKGVEVGDHIIASLIRFCGPRKDFTAGRTFDCLNPGATLCVELRVPASARTAPHWFKPSASTNVPNAYLCMRTSPPS
ncbi:MAG: alcohol dehydrogenase catalytic domain-containing protein [Candidatus Saccharibacteria bacterium]|nr:alcohol dehydrogenase catalytic domain-containing protein [Microbacteriaceae bacterium]